MAVTLQCTLAAATLDGDLLLCRALYIVLSKAPQGRAMQAHDDMHAWCRSGVLVSFAALCTFPPHACACLKGSWRVCGHVGMPHTHRVGADAKRDQLSQLRADVDR